MRDDKRTVELHLRRNTRWVDAALDLRDRRSFILAARERARLKRRLDALRNEDPDA